VCTGSEEEQHIGQDLLLRALEHRAAFGAAGQVLDAVVREVGLFPYLELDALSLADQIAYECHRPEHLEERVLHAPQAAVYRRLLAGESVVLSAPTSFGKSLIIDAVVASARYKNIVVIVPTIALIDETRRRFARFQGVYKVITHAFQKPGERNVYVMTQERLLESKIDHVDFFVIDEFYKLSPSGADA
jgi:replicative superfamily II helicase